MLQPICGYVLDVLGLKVGFAIFAIAWSLISMAHGLAHSWQALAGLRGLLGFAEGSANPGGHEGDGGVVPGEGARARRRRLQHRRVGRLDAGAAARGLGDPRLQLAVGVRDHRRHRPGLGGAVAVLLSTRRTATRALGAEERALHRGGPGAAPGRRRPRPSIARDPAAAQLLGHRAAALPGRSDLGHADLLAAAVPDARSGTSTSSRSRCSPGCRSWPPTSAACSAAPSACFLQKPRRLA